MGTITRTRVELTFARRGAATRAVSLHASGLLRARVLHADADVLRVALVQTAASLLNGDDVKLEVRCGPGARVELVEVAGLVAHDVRGGPGAALRTEVTLEEGARLAWLAQPLVLADGARLRRTVAADLAPGAILLLRDTLVLGRADAPPGALRSHLHVRHAGAPLYVEALDTGDRDLLRSPVVAGDAKVLDTVALFGARGDGADGLQLAGPGTVLPVPATSAAAAERTAGPVLARWRAALWSGGTGRPSVTEDREGIAAPAPPS